jgi:phosphoserine phosphatase RsbU/P
MSERDWTAEGHGVPAVETPRNRELLALLEFSNRLLGHGDVDGLMRHLVEEVRRLLSVDASAVLIPEPATRRIVFRAASGWRRDPVAAGHHVSADKHSGPGRVMITQQPLIIEDARENPQGVFIPEWMVAEDFRGHWVVPLMAEGRAIGALAVDMRRPLPASASDVQLLQLMANQAALALETARLQEEARRQERLAEQLRVARQIQLSLLPADAPEVPGWDVAAAYRSAQVVGGDFYDYFYLPGSPLRLGVVIADVADKGIPAALFMALSRTVIRTSALGGRRPAAVLTRANSMIAGDSQSDMFLTACYITLDLTTGRIVVANAGHNRPFLHRASDGACAEIKTRGLVLGAFEEISLEEREISLDLGDLILLYSDGVTDAVNAQGEMFGEERLREELLKHAGLSAQVLLDTLLSAIDDFTGGAAQYDDMTLVAVRRQPDMPEEAIPVDWSLASFPSQRVPAYVRRRAV